MRVSVKTKEEKKLLSKCGIIFIILVGLDQVTKYLIVSNSELIRKPLVVIPGFFDIVSVRNTGAAVCKQYYFTPGSFNSCFKSKSLA